MGSTRIGAARGSRALRTLRSQPTCRPPRHLHQGRCAGLFGGRSASRLRRARRSQHETNVGCAGTRSTPERRSMPEPPPFKVFHENGSQTGPRLISLVALPGGRRAVDRRPRAITACVSSRPAFRQRAEGCVRIPARCQRWRAAAALALRPFAESPRVEPVFRRQVEARLGDPTDA